MISFIFRKNFRKNLLLEKIFDFEGGIPSPSSSASPLDGFYTQKCFLYEICSCEFSSDFFTASFLTINTSMYIYLMLFFFFFVFHIVCKLSKCISLSSAELIINWPPSIRFGADGTRSLGVKIFLNSLKRLWCPYTAKCGKTIVKIANNISKEWPMNETKWRFLKNWKAIFKNENFEKIISIFQNLSFLAFKKLCTFFVKIHQIDICIPHSTNKATN